MGRKKVERKRIRDFSIVSDVTKAEPKNKIIDVSGVLVGHRTVKSRNSRTGVAMIVPEPRNVFDRKFMAAGYIHNELGKTCSLVQMEELGILKTLIALTNTLNVGLAADALVEYIIRQYAEEQVGVTPVSPVMGEYDDCKISRIQHRAVSMEDVVEAFSWADRDFEEGDVGAGTRTVCYGLKGGIGSASRVMRIGGKKYTLGVLVQFNFGATEDLVINGIRAGEQILGEKERRRKMATAEQDRGSIMIIIAMDLPVSSRQLKHIVRRASVGIARTSVYTGHGSGRVVIGLTTAGRLQRGDSPKTMASTCIRRDLINVALKVAAEAVREAILNPMAAAGRARGPAGGVRYSLPEFLPRILKY